MAIEHTISSVQQDSKKLIVHWDDQHQSVFHYLWLRDNCRCVDCGEPALGRKQFRITDVPLDLRLESVVVKDARRIEVVWENDRHKSTYTAQWLRQYCYSERARAQRRHRPVLWDSRIAKDLPQVNYAAVLATDAERLRMLGRVRDYGFCLVKNVPPRRGELETFAASLGVIVETDSGRIFEILLKSGEDIKSVAHLNSDLIPHHDDSYRTTFPSIIFFHCLVAGDNGSGQSVYVDGLQIAECLRREEPEAFALLSHYAVPFCKQQGGQIHMQARSPLIHLDSEGNITGVRISNLFVAPLDLPEMIVEPFYRAYRKLMDYYTARQYQLMLDLCPGDLIILDNHRVLHGRTTINAENQDRHLRHCYGDRDYLYSQWRTLNQSRALHTLEDQ
ncbi:MAG: DUF971 domain-containing protein [Gammaproteobacteria bacterium]|nr:DUF971 domain-containing protein [Rhizobiaceae bacterium]NKC13746.1 DUF971 domain-containing protein [Gammaproteobacteria bacterium]